MKNFGICALTTIPLRATPSDKSEMVSQLLYGETYEILDRQSKWALIRCEFDNYESWISLNQVELISEEYFESLKEKISGVVMTPIAKIQAHDKPFQIISFGSNIFEDSVNNATQLIEGEIIKPIKFIRSQIVGYAKRLAGVPYLWGGRSVFGIDCSGFTQIIFKASAYSLPRDASMQVHQGQLVHFIQEAESGDLAFFDNEEGQIVHVGIMIDQKTIIHASGSVRIDSMDHEGIFNHASGNYTHHLRTIKRIT